MIAKLLVVVVLSIGVLFPVSVHAASPATQTAVCGSGAGNFFGIQPWHACLPKAPDGSPRIERLTDIFKIVLPLIDSLVKIAALVAAGYMFFMLFKIAMARGDSGQISTAISGIRDAIIGIIIAMISVAAVNWISGAF